MLFSTFLTPAMFLAMSLARDLCSRVSTNPLNCTTPRYDATWTSGYLTESSLKAERTLAFNALSSMTSPAVRSRSGTVPFGRSHAGMPSRTGTLNSNARVRGELGIFIRQPFTLYGFKVMRPSIARGKPTRPRVGSNCPSRGYNALPTEPAAAAKGKTPVGMHPARRKGNWATTDSRETWDQDRFGAPKIGPALHDR